MTRDYLVAHLEAEGCYPEVDIENTVGELWINCVSGDMCYVPFDDELEVITYCHVIYELKIDPPLEYDADYHVYSGWRNNLINKAKEQQEEG